MVRRLNIYRFADWDSPTVLSFDRLLSDYETTPASKKLLNSLIKFEEMYPEIKPGPYSRDWTGKLKALNEFRRSQRARIYLRSKDLIRTVDEHSGKRLILTSRAHKIFYEDYPLAKLRKEKWDGQWTIVMYDIPDLKVNARNYFRFKLKKLGFGSPQESIYVSPLSLSEPVREMVVGEKLTEFVWVTQARRILGMTSQEIVERAWPVKSINHLYEKLLEILPKVKNNHRQKKLLLAQWRKLFLSVDAADPYLPMDLLPEDWLGEKCKRAFTHLSFLDFLRSLFT